MRVEHSEIYDAVAGIFDECGGTDNVYAYNWVHDNAKDGIKMGNARDKPARRQTAHHNVSARSGNTGILVAGSSSSPNYDALVYSNTIVSSGHSLFVETDLGGGQADVWNNIARDGESNLDTRNPAIGYCDYNLFYQTSPGCGLKRRVGDPRFVDASLKSREGARLQPGSPAIRAGHYGENIGAFDR